MIEAIIALAGVIGGFVLYFAGKRKERTDHETDTHNEYIATKARIEAAIRPDLSSADVDDSLRDHAK